MAIHLTSTGVDFAATAEGANSSNQAEVLYDYEYGDITPSLTGTSGGPSGVSFGSRTGNYVTIGQTITLQITLDINSWSSGPTGNCLITGLPYAADPGNDHQTVSVGTMWNWPGNQGPTICIVGNNSTYIYLYRYTGYSTDASALAASNMNGNELVRLGGSYHRYL